MSYSRWNYVFNTPNLLKKSYKRGQMDCWDSRINILAYSAEEAAKKLAEYIAYGRKIGWYK